MNQGQARSVAQRRAEKAAGMAAAIQWRESRRCPDCSSLGYTPCAHRPNGACGPYFAPLRMPFADHRTCAEWVEEAQAA